MPAKDKTPAPNVKPAARPAFAPAPDWIKELFNGLMRGMPQVEPRKMFGYPCAFVNGNMACGVFGDRLMVRLSDADRNRILQLPGARLFEPMPGRPMKDYIEVPPAMLKAPVVLKKWVKKSVTYTGTLPLKVKKK